MSLSSAPEPGIKPDIEVPTRAKFFLCASYALAAWAWRSWEFIVALVLINLYPKSLVMVSAYGLLDNLSRVLLGPAVGGYLDRHERLPGARAMLRLQNLCIGGSAMAALVLLWPSFIGKIANVPYWSLMWVVTLLGAASSAGSTGVSISVEREAVKALCGPDGCALAALNSIMRAIDLTALLCAPLVAGLLMTFVGPFMAVAAMAVYCGGAYMPEVLLLGAAFHAAPVLGQTKVRGNTGASGITADSGQADAGGTETEADERTGLLAEYSDGIDITTNPAAHIPAVRSIGPDQQPRSRVGGPADESAALTETLKMESRDGRGPRGRAPASKDDEDDDYDNMELGPQASSARLSQPLLTGATDSLPTSISASWLDGGEGADTIGRPAVAPGLNASTRVQRESSVRSGMVKGETLSTASSMTVLAVTAPVTAASGRGSGSSVAVVAGAALGSVATSLRSLQRGAARQLKSYCDSWSVYWQQPVLLLCLALALLYMTVLSLGFLMTSYLKWSNLTEAEVSAYRGIGALAGLAATAIFTPLSSRIGLRFCAVAGVTYQLTCLAAGVLPVVAVAVASGGRLRPSVTQVRILVAGLVSSRTGLWLYDLAVTQLIQEDVRQCQLGAVYGVQSSLQASFEMLSFMAGLVSPNPERFHWLMLGSLISVAVAATMTWCYGCLRRGRPAEGAPVDGGGSGGGFTAI